jgi:prolyl-tRNA synthetase
MRQSNLFSKTLKQAPADETSKNAQLLIRAGYIHKELSGVYAFLPLGLKVLNKIINIIREEINAIGGQEVTMTALQAPAVWQATDRWDENKVEIWFKTNLRDGTQLGLGFTHEEALTNLMHNHVRSYRDLPTCVYQFQTKFRNEVRAKSGIMRTREFIMKDLYSFCRTEQEHEEFYERAKQAYIKIFSRLGLGEKTFITFASGGSFSKFSHEFQTVSDVGEDTIYVHEGKKIAVNREVLNDEVLGELGIAQDELVEKKAIEVGNIFSLGTKFSTALNLNFSAEDGSVNPVIMGSYGIGPARVMGTMVEIMADDNGLVWPENVTPFHVHLLVLSTDPEKIEQANKLYDQLTGDGYDVLFDDRQASAGEKLADADLLGISLRLVIGSKTDADKVEFKMRNGTDAGAVDILNINALLKKVYGGIN